MSPKYPPLPECQLCGAPNGELCAPDCIGSVNEPAENPYPRQEDEGQESRG